jgi:hypothetical protein
MTAEEYIEERFKGNTDMYAYHVCNRAIEMARQEERRNAVNQLQHELFDAGIELKIEL